ncbi:MAG: BON domain-containing protein [Burkholderiales bacterium]|nr:BON domain-containing protein [Burkholderiales bacterium]MDE2625834.1 BON domain-containing protein [Burkholderiales bacterium]
MIPKLLPRAARTLLCTLAAGAALSACAPLLMGGAMVGSSLMVSDRRTTGAQVEDQSIELKSIKRINDVVGDRGHINVTSYNRVVLLTGEAASEADKAAIERAVAGIENVRSVVNELAVGPPSSFGSRSNDAFLTSKVKASMVDAKDIQANSFKVVTERGIVYLMGIVSEREANRATDIARGVSGVRKVVRVFEIVSEADLAATQPRPVPAPVPAPASAPAKP